MRDESRPTPTSSATADAGIILDALAPAPCPQTAGTAAWPRAAAQLADAEVARFGSALAAATSLEEVRHLDGRAAVIRAILKRMRHAFEVQNRFAELEARCARKLGLLLRGQVKKGGCGSNSRTGRPNRGGSSAPLPEWLNWSRSSRCQRLAAIPEREFERFLSDARAHKRLITQASLLRLAKGRHECADPGDDQDELASLWDAVQRLMDVDLAIGVAAEPLAALRAVSHAAGWHGVLRGCVVVDAVDDEARWLSRLATDRAHGHLSEAVVLMRALTAASWFRLVGEHGWSCCFLAQGRSPSARAAAYLGPRHAGFHTVAWPLGTVMRSRA